MPGVATVPGAACQLYLFGPTQIVDADGTTVLTGANMQRLVGYLALHPRVAHRREALADALWPDFPISTSRRTLSDTLYRLRARTRERWIRAVGDTIALARDHLWVDVWEFDRLAESGTRAAWDSAIALHTADLLPGVYDDWALAQRVARRAVLVALLERTVAADESTGDLQRALTGSRRVIVTEPLYESAHQTYLRLLGRLGRHGEAVTHLEQMTTMFASELGAAPLPETRRIVEQMLGERGAIARIDDRSAFVGRARERGVALRAVEAACDGHGSVVAIEGEAGIGKTRLMGEVLHGARWRGALTLLGDVRDVPEAAPLGPLARALAPMLVGASLAHIESSLDTAARATLAQLHPPWSDLVADRVDTSAGAEQVSARLNSALRALGRALAGLGPAVIALDDVHWATADLWNAVAELVDGFVRGGGLVVVTYRRPGIEATAGWAKLQEWDRAGLLVAITLGPFGKDEVLELLATSDEGADEVLAVTGGNPFWVAQWVIGAGGKRHVDRSAMIHRRLETLTTPQRAALEGGAVLGERVVFGVWTDVVQCSPIELAAVAEQLTLGRWVTPSADGYEFAHGLIRDAVYEQIPMSRRRSLHDLAAAALARRDPDNARTRAYHLDRAGHAVQAADWYRRAGHQSVATYAMRDAVDAYSRSFELQPKDARRARLEVGLELAKACESVNDYDRQRPALASVTALARELGDDAALLRALLIAGLAASRTGDAEGSVRLLSEASDLAERAGDERRVVEATYLLADLRAQQGQWQAAEAAWLPVRDYARRVGDLTLLGCVLRGLAITAKQMGDPQSAVRLLEDSVAALRQSGDRVNELYTSSNLLGVLYDLEAWDRLLAHADEMWPIAEMFGDPVTIGVVRHQQGLAALALGDHATARAMMSAAEDAFAAAERPRMVGLVVNTIGLVAEDEGNLAEAESLYRQALDTAVALDAATESAYVRHDLGALLVRTGRPGEAISLLRAAAGAWAEQRNALLRAKSEAHLGLALLAADTPVDEATALADAGTAMVRAGAPPGEQPQGWLWALAQLLDLLDRPTDAAFVLASARVELDRQAQAISDADMRRQFFERVPVNRAIVSAHSRRLTWATPLSVELASIDAPLGRKLSDDERVQVQWTLHAPDDEAIGDKGARRRHRLVRLLEEAAAAGGSPTDDDLAAALGVSRRTILRDFEMLPSSVPLTTRRRSRGQRSPSSSHRHGLRPDLESDDDVVQLRRVDRATTPVSE